MTAKVDACPKRKLKKVLKFAKPTCVKELRSFLGLVNYFRDQMKDHAQIVRPLQDMLNLAIRGDRGANKKALQRRALSWGPLQHSAFEATVQAVADCPKLYFLDEEVAGPIDVVL